MTGSHNFSELLTRVRQGDGDAAFVLVQRYESAIRVAVRTRLSDPRLRRQFDSMDVCQSVLASFFLHVAAGSYQLNDPRQLVALLVKMAQHKLGMRVRGEFRQRRDARRISTEVETSAVACRQPGPVRQAAGRDLLNYALEKMPPDIRTMAERRMRGEAWDDIARDLGGSADARRKQFERAVSAISDSLDLAPIED